MAKSYWKDLKVWQKSHSLALSIYKATVGFPKEEIYGLTSQVRRSAVSVATNIVEGHSRKTTKDFIHFLYNSRGSLEETRYLILLAQELTFLSADEYDALEEQASEVSRMLNAMIPALEEKED